VQQLEKRARQVGEAAGILGPTRGHGWAEPQVRHRSASPTVAEQLLASKYGPSVDHRSGTRRDRYLCEDELADAADVAGRWAGKLVAGSSDVRRWRRSTDEQELNRVETAGGRRQ
jgi:hypothetical protein